MQYTGRQAEGFQIMSKQKRALQRRFDDSLSVFLFFPPLLLKLESVKQKQPPPCFTFLL